MANNSKFKWRDRVLSALRKTNTFLNRYGGMSLSAILAFLVAWLWYYNLVNVAKDLQKEKARGENTQTTTNPSDSIQSSNNPNARNANTLVNTPPDAQGYVQYNYTDAEAYNEFRDSKPLERLLNLLRRPVLWVVCVFSTIILIVFVLIHRRRVFLEKQVRENDSVDFLRLLKNFEGQIAKLGTPRRVKRQINKLRFQYNLLENEKWLFQEQNQKFLFEISLQAELDHSIFDSFENLKKTQQMSEYPGIDQTYLRRIYELNENVYAGDGVDKKS